MTSSNPRKRYREIGTVLARHGFEWLWLKWGVGSVFGKFEAHHADPAHAKRTQAENLRLTLEQLGTTFIKLGQMLSMRQDLLPDDYILELSKLQDDAPKVPYDAIASIIQSELGNKPEAVFQSFDIEPRAAGSVAQVHNAILPDGTHVVVKIRRPGIELQVDEDLAILGHIARFLSQNTEIGKSHDVEGLADEFAYTLRNELDFVREGQNAERIAAEFADDPALHVPTIHWEFSTRLVLTMEDIRGIKIDDLEALDAAGMDRKELAKRCAHIVLVQVLDYGFFHADPHPGNFFVQSGGVIALIDYGMVGRLEDRLRGCLLRLFLAISRHDTERIIDELLSMGATKKAVDRHTLGRDLQHLLSKYDGLALGSLSIVHIFRDVSEAARRHGLTLPSDLVVLARVIAMDEGLGGKLDPEFNLMEFSQPYFKRFWLKDHSLKATVRRIREQAIDIADMGADIPERLLRLSGVIERGELMVTTRVEVEDSLTKNIQQAANRIAVSVLTAGLIVGLSVMTIVFRTPNSPAFDFLLRLFFVSAVASGLWLLAAFWRSTRK